MNPAPLLSIISGALALMLSVVFLAKNSTVQSKSGDLQKQQTEFQTQQQTLATQQQQFQNLQAQVQSAAQLAQQVGPQVLNDLGLVAREKKNDKIRKVLEKYGVTINDKPAATPAPAAGSTPKPADAPKPQ